MNFAIRTVLLTLMVSCSAIWAESANAQSPTDCFYDGKPFSKSAVIIRDGIKMQCESGAWASAGDVRCAYQENHYSEGAVISPVGKNTLVCRSGNWKQAPCLTRRVGRTPAKLVSKAKPNNWTVCLQYDKSHDGPDAGSVRITVRGLSDAPSTPHRFEETILGISQTGSNPTESCVVVGVRPDEVLSAVQSSGSTEGRSISFCAF
jgi:hypothetical protein